MASYPPIQFKRSSVLGSVPTAADLLVGEIAINLEDRKIYTKTIHNEVIVIGANYDSELEISDSDIRVAVHDFLENDSDFKLDLDSEIQARRNADSDLRRDIDSDITLLYDADSDLLYRIDSDIKLLYDADSDLLYRIDSDIKLLYDADSDLLYKVDSDIQLLYNADSDLRYRVDSEFSNLKLENLVNVEKEYTKTVVTAGTGDIVASGWEALPQPDSVKLNGTYTQFETNRITADNATGTLFAILLMPDTGRYTAYQKDNGDGTYSYIIPKSQENAAQNMVAGALTIEGWSLLITNSATTFDPTDPLNSNTGNAFPHSPFQVVPTFFDAFENGTVTIADSATGLPLNITDGASAVAGLDPGSTTTVLTEVSHLDVLAFDSDLQKWIPSKGNAVNKIEQFTATDKQTVFAVASDIKGDVLLFRNGVLLDTSTFTISGTDITYVPANNSNQQMKAGDKVIVQYATLNT